MNLRIDKDSKFERKGGGKININARYYLAPFSNHMSGKAFDVIDRARELQFLPAVIFSNGSEQECREWILRNCEEPVEPSEGPFAVKSLGVFGPTNIVSADGKPVGFSGTSVRSQRENEVNACLFAASWKLLALLEQYHQSFPSKESGKLICEARNWTIQE